MESLREVIDFIGGPAAIWRDPSFVERVESLDRGARLRARRTVEAPVRVYDNNPLTAQFAGLIQLKERIDTAERWEDKLAYLWRPPEWSHDGVCRSDCPKYLALRRAA